MFFGTVIVKSSHLHARGGTQCTEIEYSYADANEVRAIALARTVLNDVNVPKIYFAGKVLTFPPRLSAY
jgi:ABC-type sulfate transport system permease subunit